jgi:hypothetical protein
MVIRYVEVRVFVRGRQFEQFLTHSSGSVYLIMKEADVMLLLCIFLPNTSFICFVEVRVHVKQKQI